MKNKDDYTKIDPFYLKLPPNTVIESYQEDGLFTVVYNGLDGFGVIEGEHRFLNESELPEPEYMLKEKHSSLPCIGEYVKVIKKGVHF